MAARPGGIEKRLEAFHRLCEGGDAAQVSAAVARALHARHRLMVAAAARICGERLLYEQENAMKNAYSVFLKDPEKTDKQCVAKSAIVRALVALDSQDVTFYLDNIAYRQFEPVWGGRVDTAVDLRCSCAMGLVGTAYPRALIPLADLLNDPEPQARLGAVRALVCAQPLAAEALLRHKAGAVDESAEVVGECLLGLLQLAPEDSMTFVAGFLGAEDEAVAELAALALGESRLDEALEALQKAWEGVLLGSGLRRALLRAAVLHRSLAAREWLLALIADARAPIAAAAVEELAAFRHDVALAEAVAGAVGQRSERVIEEAWRASWGQVD